MYSIVQVDATFVLHIVYGESGGYEVAHKSNLAPALDPDLPVFGFFYFCVRSGLLSLLVSDNLLAIPAFEFDTLTDSQS